MRETFSLAWQNPWVRLAVYLALGLLLAWLLAWVAAKARMALTIVGLSFILSYLASPVVRWFEERRLTRALGVVAVFVGGLFFLGLATVLLLGMTSQLSRFLVNLPAILAPLEGWVQQLPDRLGQVPLPPLLREALAQATGNLELLLEVFTQTLLRGLQSLLAQGGGNLLNFFAALLGGAFQLLTVITLSIYLLYDLPRIGAQLFTFIPRPYQPRAAELLEKADRAFGGYVRGTILGALANAGLVTLAMYLSFGPFQGFSGEVLTQSMVLGFLAFIFSFVPVIGVLISAVPALLLALPLGLGPLLVVALALWICNQLQGVIWPLIMRQTTSLHP
ncbi:AI-2E family transporter, partial [Meiothermus rufus]|uniref:AI-2E family transporter n=1 Tax=Meiothermus rufus TaxID=604332 RepID=UPI0004236A68